MKKHTTLLKLTLFALLITFAPAKLFAQKTESSVATTDSSKAKPKTDGKELEAFLRKVQQYSADQKRQQQPVGAGGMLGNTLISHGTVSNVNGIAGPPAANSKMSVADREKLTLDFNRLQSQLRLQQEQDLNQAQSSNDESIKLNQLSKPLIIRTKNP